MATKPEEKRCWCKHLARWHNFAGVCRWCARKELRHPEFNFMPRHPLATEIPEEVIRREMNANAGAVE